MKIVKIIDISVPIGNGIPLWPKAKPPRLREIKSIKKGDRANETRLEFGAHTGTHIDAPLHFLKNGKPVEKLPLNIFFGLVYVAHLPNVKLITTSELEKLEIPPGTERLLFKTSNSKLWKSERRFRKEYVGISTDGARWLARRKLKLIGVDYLSVAAFNETKPVHQILLRRKITLLEGINLSKVQAGEYTICCFPIKIEGSAEGASVRAVLMK